MKLDLRISSGSAIGADNILRAHIVFNDPRTTPPNQSQSADIIINCDGILDLCAHAPASAFDFFFIAACAYGIDRFIERRPYSVDGWSRELKMTVPVLDITNWQGKEQEVAGILSFLTGDYWDVQFTTSSLVLPSQATVLLSHKTIDHVNLFSGGLDSLIGAIDFLEQEPTKNLLLISHYDPNMAGPKGDQIKLYTELSSRFKQPIAWSESVGVYLENASLGTRENTLRSRSLLFISLAVLAANAYGHSIPVWVPENGSVSLNYPLSPSRRSACSTRTTHPRLLEDVRQLLGGLQLANNVTNPYETLTKGEMVVNCADLPFLLSIINFSNSCGKRGHKNGWKRSATHCGVCMPCVYRRAALANYADNTTYGIYIEELKRDSSNSRLIGKRGQDLDACLEFLKNNLSFDDIQTELIVNGLNDFSMVPQFANVVQKTRKELKDWIRQNPDSVIRHKAGMP
ncbi:hypothetical protein H7F15_01425 [Pontibacter sp. Tf4]|uniref:Qat anti-phage system QueC-like protein QatC n=1 Tax=Pontibacter sp. Tf4 TaxID=2761620 RepID=UPI0016286A14|nr:Qat anti-phage system QueC-like protein QatC [Pontibacter sp. Tf4]MBB6609686.1 hypothetical protein [Pontibacter sp. Tf4]